MQTTKEKLEKLQKILDSLHATDRWEAQRLITEVLEETYKAGIKEGAYHTRGPTINLYPERSDDEEYVEED